MVSNRHLLGNPLGLPSLDLTWRIRRPETSPSCVPEVSFLLLRPGWLGGRPGGPAPNGRLLVRADGGREPGAAAGAAAAAVGGGVGPRSEFRCKNFWGGHWFGNLSCNHLA